MKLSIITVCLNSEETIEQTIKSVLNQGYEDLEYIIVDGKSTDGTMNIVNKYKDKLSKVISEPDDGLYDAMNKGIRIASGDVIAIINSDDWYEPDVFARVVECFKDMEVQVVYGKENLIDNNVKVSERVEIKMAYWNVPTHPTLFVRKEVYEQYGLYDTQYMISADMDFMMRLMAYGVKFAYIDTYVTNFRMSGISNQRVAQRGFESWKVKKKYLNFLPVEEFHHWKPIVYANCFQYLLRVKPEEFVNKLEEIVCKERNIYIWGAGKWGSTGCDILSNVNLTPKFLIDKNSELWGTCLNGVQIVAPQSLKEFKGTVLILVKNYSKEIAEQIAQMEISNLRCIRWEDLVEMM